MLKAYKREALQGSLERILKFAKSHLHMRNRYLQRVRIHQCLEGIWGCQLEVLKVDDDVHACLIGRFLDSLNQFQGIQAIEGTIKIHKQRGELVMPFGLDMEYQLLCREGIRIQRLFECMQRARNQLFSVQHR